jgi:hypothetical protein
VTALPSPGDRVTWNEQGVALFGPTQATALVVAIEGTSAHLLWETDQETWASVSCLQRVPESITEETP